MSAQPLARFAGFEPPDNGKALAIAASHRATAKVRRWQNAARCSPPTAAKGGFPYHARTCAKWISP